MPTIPTNIHVKKGEVLQMSTIESVRWHMHFRPFGIRNLREEDSIDAVQYIWRFNKAELFLFQAVYANVEEDNRLTLRPKSYTKAEQAKLGPAITSWIRKDLLRRIKREHYMVNPWFLIPPKDEQLNAIDRWRALRS